MSARVRGVVWPIVVAAMCSAMLLHLMSVSERYPYYFVWDMDHVVGMDSVLINSGLLPDSLSHPGFGMNLVLTASEKAARRLNTISAGTLDDLDESLNPIGAMAELTDYLRRHTPFVCVAIVVMSWTAVCLMFRLPWWQALLALALLGSQESLSYQASMIRSELYAVLFWSGAALAAAIVARTRTTARQELGELAVGVLLGLSFLTKVQALFYLAAAIIVMLLFRSLADEESGVDAAPPATSPRRARLFAGIGALNIFVFLGLALVSVRTHIPEGVGTFATHQGITPMAVAMGLGMTGLLIVQLLAAGGRRVPFDGVRIGAALVLINAGFFLAFAFHFLVFADPAASWLYLVYDFKMLFVRQAFYQLSPKIFLESLSGFIGHNPLLYASHVALLIALAAGSTSRTIRVSRGQLAWCTAASCVALVNLGLGTRFILRDGIWAETLVNFLSLVYLAMIATRATRHQTLLGAGGATLVALMVAVNVVLASSMTQRIDANYNHYGWLAIHWSGGVYGFNQPRYAAIIERHYDKDTLRTALLAGVDHERIRHTAEFVFPSESPNHRNIGIAALNLPVWARDPRYKIAALPPSLSGAIVVDPLSTPNRGRPLFKEAAVRGESESFDKFKPSSARDRLPVLTRRDLRILIFVPSADAAAFQTEFIKPTDLGITLKDSAGGGTIEMRGLEVTNYSEVPFDAASSRYFFVITSQFVLVALGE
jgi:hypothetical protein